MKRIIVKLMLVAALSSIYSFGQGVIPITGPTCQSGDGRFSCSCFVGETCTSGADWCTCG